MIKKIVILLAIILLEILQLHATSNDEDFSISIDNWFCSVQWNDEVDLPYLDRQETYYSVLKIISENYDYISSLSDTILFYVQRCNDGYRVTTYFNDKKIKADGFTSLQAFQHILNKQLNSFYSFSNKKNYFYLYKVKVSIHKGDFLRDIAEIKFNSSSETISTNGFYEYIFIRKAALKKYDKNDYEIKCSKIYIESRNGEASYQNIGGT